MRAFAGVQLILFSTYFPFSLFQSFHDLGYVGMWWINPTGVILYLLWFCSVAGGAMLILRDVQRRLDK